MMRKAGRRLSFPGSFQQAGPADERRRADVTRSQGAVPLSPAPTAGSSRQKNEIVDDGPSKRFAQISLKRPRRTPLTRAPPTVAHPGQHAATGSGRAAAGARGGAHSLALCVRHAGEGILSCCHVRDQSSQVCRQWETNHEKIMRPPRRGLHIHGLSRPRASHRDPA
jgi:hypothetical protein